jgi:hypothetical protein
MAGNLHDNCPQRQPIVPNAAATVAPEPGLEFLPSKP